MTSVVEDLDKVIERYQLAIGEFMKGDPKPVQNLFSHREDVSLANPYGPPCAGGSGLRRSRSTPRPCAGTARPLALRS
jgi:hypothetical protein